MKLFTEVTCIVFDVPSPWISDIPYIFRICNHRPTFFCR